MSESYCGCHNVFHIIYVMHVVCHGVCIMCFMMVCIILCVVNACHITSVILCVMCMCVMSICIMVCHKHVSMGMWHIGRAFTFYVPCELVQKVLGSTTGLAIRNISRLL